MNFQDPSLIAAGRSLLLASLFLLGGLLFLCILRAMWGPRIADRLLSVNMAGTMTIAAIAILALLTGEGYLADVSLLYAFISFLAVVVLTHLGRKGDR